jgi:hypothetical protein
MKAISKSNKLTIISQFELPNRVEYETFFMFIYYLFGDPSPGALSHTLKEEYQVINSGISIDKSFINQILLNVSFAISDKYINDSEYLSRLTKAY